MTTGLSLAATERLAVTPEEARFADLLYLGVEPKLAAEQAGIGEHYSRVLRRPGMRALLREKHSLELEGSLLPVTAQTLRDVLTSPIYTGASKVSAAKLVWSAAGLLPTGVKSREPHAPTPGMPAPEGAEPPSIKGMESNLRTMQDMLADMRKRLIAAEPIDVTPRQSSLIDL